MSRSVIFNDQWSKDARNLPGKGGSNKEKKIKWLKTTIQTGLISFIIMLYVFFSGRDLEISLLGGKVKAHLCPFSQQGSWSWKW